MTAYYYTWDHLGSVREMLNSSGTIVARYGYDPYGRTTLVSGTNLATFQYAKMYMHQPSELYLTKGSGSLGAAGRFYDTGTGRWGNRDPIEERGGINLYGYVDNDPVDLIDPRGLFPHGYTPYNPPDDDDPTRPFKPPIMPDVPMPPFWSTLSCFSKCMLLTQPVSLATGLRFGPRAGAASIPARIAFCKAACYQIKCSRIQYPIDPQFPPDPAGDPESPLPKHLNPHGPTPIP